MGFFDKIKQGLQKTKESMSAVFNSTIAGFTGENEEFFDDIEEALIMADVGAESAMRAVDDLRDAVDRNGARGEEGVRKSMVEVMSKMLPSGAELDLSTNPAVILVVGVNGVGKTTTIGKIATNLVREGHKVMLAAGDTFRAAAAEQLTIWAQRAGADIVRHEEGSDPAAVVFDAISAAKARGCDVIIVDTAGRLHNKSNLMNELSKISRVIDRELPDAARETLLVLDATTGQNGLNQAEEFQKSVPMTGIVLTKLDGTAKGGIVFAINDKLGVPVKFVGVGEGQDDLIPFNSKDFVEALLG
ncbi:MAG: signal recognition particle-docking protein FtsY [Oscillospiraceae bacterium]|nr:signal recognition particle-docking protein FtsY [Oscillospiraceae bacterium]